MGEFAKMAGEILFAVFPQSDWGKLLGLAILGIFVLVYKGRIRVEWICHGTRYIYRWLRCKIADKPHYPGYIGMVNPDGSGGSSFVQCRICGKRYHLAD